MPSEKAVLVCQVTNIFNQVYIMTPDKRMSTERNNGRRQKRAHENAKHLRHTNTLHKSNLDSCLTTDQNRKG